MAVSRYRRQMEAEWIRATSAWLLLRYNRLMRRPLLAAAAVLTLTVLIPSSPIANAQSNQNEPSAQESAPDVPDAIAVPAGETVQFFVTAKLRDRKDKVIGQHFADPTTKLPTWKLKDGSEVSGKAAAHVDSLDSDSIPWLLVNVVSHAGKPGLLTNVTTIQRVHTHGGKLGNDACDETHKDTETKSDYKADYYFFAPAK